MDDASICQPGRNCWRVERAHRAAFLIDGANYYAAFREAVLKAKHSVFILGWDIESNLRLTRDGDDDPSLGRFLNEVVSERPDLEVYVLIWDFAMIYAAEREWLPVYRLGWKTHRRLHFRLDDRHPIGGSQHQKIVVVDDSLVFLGGMDLSRSRWDTPEHKPGDPRRVNAAGDRYVPYHDVQLMVDGPAAAALGELARYRWRRATGENLGAPQPAGDPWPDGVGPDLTDVDLALARTFPKHNGQDEVREVERLYLDSIAAAERSLYIENQYLTSSRIRDALAARLKEEDGPEVVIVVPEKTGGWLEQNTMDVLRRDLIRTLREADRYGRLRVTYPYIEGLAPEHLSVHSKVMVVDDRLVRLGSSNLSNRSMGLDSECDAAVEAHTPRVRTAIRNLRARLLSEHLGADPEALQREKADDSLLATLRRFEGGPRYLTELDENRLQVDPEIEALVSQSNLVDPERPVEPEQLAQQMLPEEHHPSARRRVAGFLLTIAALVALAAAWHWTPLNQWLDVQTVVAAVGALDEHALAPWFVVTGYLVGGFVMVPVTFMVVVTVLAFGPLEGFLLALAGSLVSAAATYGLGHIAGRRTIRRVAGSRLNRLSQRFAKRGLLTVIGVRIVPVAPFTVVNLVAGASHIRFWTYMLGTLLGMTPGLVGLSAFMDRLVALVRHPDTMNFALAAGVAAVLVVAGFLVQRWLRRRRLVGANGEEAV